MMERNESSIEGNCNIVTQGNKNLVSVINNITIVDAEHSEMFKERKYLMLLGEKDTLDTTEADTHVSVPTKGANVYLSINVLFANKLTGGVGLSLGVTVTNFNEIHRYFNQPVFKRSIPFNDGLDTFYLTNMVDDTIIFPKRLEYGEVFTVNYKISKDIIDKVFTKIGENSDVTIKAVLHTTLGETFFSNECPVSKIVNVANQIEQI